MSNNYEGKQKELVNMLIIILKQYVYSSKCKQEIPNFIGLVAKMRYWYLVDKQIASENNKLEQFNKKWNDVF